MFVNVALELVRRWINGAEQSAFFIPDCVIQVRGREKVILSDPPPLAKLPFGRFRVQRCAMAVP